MQALLKLGFFPKSEALRENRREKEKVSAVLADTSGQIALETEVEAGAKPLNVTYYSLTAKRSHENLSN
jgi:hypothetical protein